MLLPLLRARPGGVVKLIQTKIGAMWPADRAGARRVPMAGRHVRQTA